MKQSLLLCTFFFLGMVQLHPLKAQSTSARYELDLATSVNAPKKMTVPANTYFTVRLLNKILDKDLTYSMTVIRQNSQIEVIPLPSDFPQPTHPAVASEECSALQAKSDALRQEKKEEEVPGVLKDLQKEVSRLEKLLLTFPVETQTCLRSRIQEAKELMDFTVEETGPHILRNGEELVITISRKAESGTRSWVHTYSTQPRGSWQVSYGFSVLPQLFSKEGKYFSKAQDDQFVITKEHNRRWMSYAPSIFFTWLPYEKELQNTYGGLSAGLGYDFENPTLFLGYHFSYNQNVKMHFGIVAHKQQQLLGKYSAGQVLTENLGESQLHENLYRLNPFLSLSLRLSKAPTQSTGTSD